MKSFYDRINVIFSRLVWTMGVVYFIISQEKWYKETMFTRIFYDCTCTQCRGFYCQPCLQFTGEEDCYLQMWRKHMERFAGFIQEKGKKGLCWEGVLCRGLYVSFKVNYLFVKKELLILRHDTNEDMDKNALHFLNLLSLADYELKLPGVLFHVFVMRNFKQLWCFWYECLVSGTCCKEKPYVP